MDTRKRYGAFSIEEDPDLKIAIQEIARKEGRTTPKQAAKLIALGIQAYKRQHSETVSPAEPAATR